MIKELMKNKIFRNVLFNLGYLDFLVVVTGQACSLRCKNCGNFSPYISREVPFYKYSNIIRDMEVILRNIKHLQECQLQGGEFFLHKDAIKILKYLISNRKISKIIIASNGVVPSLSSELIKILRNEKISIRISDYGSVNFKERNELIKRLRRRGIEVNLYKFAFGKQTWVDLGKNNIRKNNEIMIRKKFEECIFKGCLTLENGRIAQCSRGTIAHRIQKFEPKGTLDIYDTKFRKKLVQYLCFPKHMEACHYCNGNDGEIINAAIQI